MNITKVIIAALSYFIIFIFHSFAETAVAYKPGPISGNDQTNSRFFPSGGSLTYNLQGFMADIEDYGESIFLVNGNHTNGGQLLQVSYVPPPQGPQAFSTGNILFFYPANTLILGYVCLYDCADGEIAFTSYTKASIDW